MSDRRKTTVKCETATQIILKVCFKREFNCVNRDCYVKVINYLTLLKKKPFHRCLSSLVGRY